MRELADKYDAKQLKESFEDLNRIIFDFINSHDHDGDLNHGVVITASSSLPLADNLIFVGQNTGYAGAVAMSGMATIVNSGAVTLQGSPIFDNITDSAMTAGSVLFAGAGGLISQNNDHFFWDNTNRRLGIRTNSPQHAVHIDCGNIRMDRVVAPTAPTVATGAAGVLTGAYYYRITFVSASGETEGGTVSAIVNPSGEKVELTNIPISTHCCVTGRKIYRTTAGGYDYRMQLVDTIADNTTTVYSDNTADGALGVYAPTMNSTGGELYNETNRILNAGNGTTVLGVNALIVNTGTGNTAIGYRALEKNTIAGSNTMIGQYAGAYLTTGGYNTGVGASALASCVTGGANTGVGTTVLYSCTGDSNVGFGSDAGRDITSGGQNVFIGRAAGHHASQLATASNSMAIGYNAYTTASNQAVFGNASITSTILRGAVEIPSTNIAGQVAITPFTTAGVLHNAITTGIVSSSLIVQADIGTGLYLPTTTDQTNWGTAYSQTHVHDQLAALETTGTPFFRQLTLNTDGESIDPFRVAGDTNANLIYVDGVNDRLGFGLSNPSTFAQFAGIVTNLGEIINNDTTHITFNDAAGTTPLGSIANHDDYSLTIDVSGTGVLKFGDTGSIYSDTGYIYCDLPFVPALLYMKLGSLVSPEAFIDTFLAAETNHRFTQDTAGLMEWAAGDGVGGSCIMGRTLSGSSAVWYVTSTLISMAGEMTLQGGLTLSSGGSTVTAPNVTVNGTLSVREGGASPIKYTSFVGGDQTIDLSYTLPTAYPVSVSQYLKSTTGGVWSWATLTQAEITGLTTDSSPTFAGLTVNGTTLINNQILTLSDTTSPSGNNVTFEIIAETGANEQRFWIMNFAKNHPGLAGYFSIYDYTDSVHRLMIADDGKLIIGDGLDTNLYRSAANTLKTDDDFICSALTSTGLTVNANKINISTAKTPSSASDTGTTGDICWDTGFLYVCIGTNTWVRAAIATWS